MGSMAGRKRSVLIALLAVLVLGALLAYQVALKELKARLLAGFGPGAEIGAIEISGRAVEISHLRVAAPAGFPAADEFRAARIRVEPDLSSLWHPDELRVEGVEIDGAYLAVVRTRQGKLEVAPSLLPVAPRLAAISPGALRLTHVVLHDLALEFIDAEVRTPPHRIVLADLAVELGPLHYPIDNSRIEFSAKGVVRSAAPTVPDGTVSLSGWLDPGTGDSRLNTDLARVDLVALEPYLLRATEAGVRRGTLSLEMRADVRDRQITAPGVLTLDQLELSPTGHGLSTFMGVPREAVVNGLKDHAGEIRLHFELEGRVDDPNFSLREGFALQAGTELAKVMGVTIAGVVKGVGSAGQVGLSAGEQVVKGVGDVLGHVLHP